ncbi:CWF19-like protein 1 [Xenia sp. Carnegie-2017]|uniref:CWF19-like protein 1 n=1 Tax=Xenia sp. Carnegie-2017 TaxID=2897299 RepID=UPI001F04B13E|nr:CWF19-like protein 1 [Xenia sp. Carnegie-2017]
MDQKPYKILVCGDVNGKLKTLYKRVSNILKKSNDFEMLLCVGNFFGTTEEDKNVWKEYREGISCASIITYILGPTTADHLTQYENINLLSGGELCQNIIYLGRSGILQCPNGLQVAYVSGLDCKKTSKEGCFYKEEDMKQLYAKIEDTNFKGVDMLLTTEWPKNVTQYGNKVDSNTDMKDLGSETISRLAAKLKPRYHFTALESTYYERLPYRNHQVLREPSQHVTRFISLASVGNTLKKKYLYAFNIVPLNIMKTDDLVKQPDDVTESPYGLFLKSKHHQQTFQQNVGQNFFFNLSSGSSGEKRKNENAAKLQLHLLQVVSIVNMTLTFKEDTMKNLIFCFQTTIDNLENEKATSTLLSAPIQGPCWFCLGGSQVEKHLIVSVADHVYLAMAKGGLTTDHTLICPIAHYPSTVEMPDEALMEIEKYKSSLRKLFKKQDDACVVYERNFYTQHLQIQVIPVPKEKADDLKGLFMEIGSEKNIEFDMLDNETDLKQIMPPQVPFFLVEFDDGCRMLHRVKRKMPLQFGREVLASPSVLNMEEKIDWKSCKLPIETEKRVTEEFRRKFRPFDFSLS